MFISGLFIGFILGFILQRGQFCLSAQLRNITFSPSFKHFSPLLIAISIQSIGFFILERMQFIVLPRATMPILATLLGGLLFGIGMGISQRCITGHLYRSGEGLISSWIVLISFALTMSATQTGILKFPISNLLTDGSQLITIPQTLGISPLYLIILLTAFTLYCCYKSNDLSLQYLLPKNFFKQIWPPQFTAILLALISILAWFFSAQTGREFGLSFSIPVGNVVQYVVTAQQRYFNWGTYLVFGVILGSLFSAWLSDNLIWRSPTPKNCLTSIIGGVLMAIGASLAGGCTMANTVVATAYFSWQGWIATIMMMLGLIISTKVKYFIQNIHSAKN